MLLRTETLKVNAGANLVQLAVYEDRRNHRSMDRTLHICPGVHLQIVRKPSLGLCKHRRPRVFSSEPQIVPRMNGLFFHSYGHSIVFDMKQIDYYKL
jgi:hypothetical protein